MEFIKKILYVGTSLNIQVVKDFEYVKEFVLIDNQPRSKSDRYYFSDKDYNEDFLEELLKISSEYGFILNDIYMLDENYYKNILNLKKQIYYSFFKLPDNLNPELYIFENKDTNQVIKYYISTNILYNMNYTLLEDIRDCNTLIINDYIPDVKLFDYFNKMEIFIGYIKTCFSTSNICINNLPSKFKKYYLFNNNSLIECNDLIHLIILKLYLLNN